MDDVIIVMGPEGIGKTTVCRDLSYYLDLPHIKLDGERAVKLKSYGYSPLKALFNYMLGKFWKVYHYTKPYEFQMVVDILEQTERGIIDLGAGSVIYHNIEQQDKIKELLSKFKFVFLLLPSPDRDLSLSYLNELNTHLSHISPNVNEYFIDFDYKELSKYTLYTNNRSLCRVSKEIEKIYKNEKV